MDDSTRFELNKVLSSRITSGVLIIDSSASILYLNEEARSILATCIPRSREFEEDSEAMNAAISALLQGHLRELSAGQPSCIYAPDSDSTYSLRALALEPQQGQQEHCTMILIEGVTLKRSFDINKVQEQFGLSKRETEVTLCLTKGMTNKEIAQALSISPETVNGYVKQVMKKLNTTTRSGIVGRVLP